MNKYLQELWEQVLHFFTSRTVWGVRLDNLVLKAFYAIVIIMMIFWLLPSERPFEYQNLTVGSIAREEIVAPFTFPILKTDAELKKERQQAWLSVPRVFVLQETIANNQQLTLEAFFNEFRRFFNTVAITDSQPLAEQPLFNTETMDSLIREVTQKYNVALNHELIRKGFQLFLSHRLDSLEMLLKKGLAEVYSQGVINRSKDKIPENSITIRKVNPTARNGDTFIEENKMVTEVYDQTEAAAHIYNLLKQFYADGTPELELANVLVPVIVKPNLIYEEALTQQRKNKAVHEVPPTRGFVYKNQIIIEANEIVTEDIYRKLQSLAVALKERATLRDPWQKLRFSTGKLIFALAVLVIWILFTYYYKRPLLRDNKLLGLLTIIFVIQFLFILLIGNVLHWHHYSIPIILAPMLISMLLDARISFVSTVVLALVVGAYRGNDFTFGVMALIVGTIALYSVQKIRNRGQMFRAILLVILTYFFIKLGFGFLFFEPARQIFTSFAFYLLPNAILTPTAVFLLIGIFEKLFDVTTDITLLELSDLNHPLLKRLSVEAPGTFHHSIIVGNLSEAAAEKIGANALLARVGSYYHDVGKMLKPEYFVENQVGTENKHESLSPHMSTLILVNHVKAGLELAEKYRLPGAVKRFIPEHHGTSLITYFYHKALEVMDPSEVREDDFRYPGPKPQSKETAIVMLADTVEAASRTLENPTPQRIRNLVNTLVEKKIQEGQLDDSDLTLKEINRIKEAFVLILMGIHHLRIEYPKEDNGTMENRKESTAGKAKAIEEKHHISKKGPEVKADAWGVKSNPTVQNGSRQKSAKGDS